MAAWLQAALRLLAQAGLFVAGSEIAQRAFGDPNQPVLGPGASGGPFRFPGQDGAITVIDPRTGLPFKRRRRRRRALTASDRADIAFVAGILGKVAGKEIAAIIAART